MAKRRQIYIVLPENGAKPGAPMRPLGQLNELIPKLAPFNIAPDGSGPQGMGEALGMAVMYGPGFVVEMPTGTDEVAQAIVTLHDEDFAWAVLGKLCKAVGWKMMDPETGRTSDDGLVK